MTAANRRRWMSPCSPRVFLMCRSSAGIRAAIGKRVSARFDPMQMSMRTWVIQPGFMLTHWQTLRYAGWTVLGAVSLVAALAAMFYTTASDALVSPKLQFGRWEDMAMQGLVRTQFANPAFIGKECQTPVGTDEDPNFSVEECNAITYAGDSTLTLPHFCLCSLFFLKPFTVRLVKNR